jgi:hypothetical protein
LLLPIIGGRIQPGPGVFTGLRGRDMAEKMAILLIRGAILLYHCSGPASATAGGSQQP